VGSMGASRLTFAHDPYGPRPLWKILVSKRHIN